MIDGFTEAQIISALALALVASYVAFFGWLVVGIHRLDRKIDRKIDALDTKLSARMDRTDSRIEALTIAVSRLEGAVYHGLPSTTKE